MPIARLLLFLCALIIVVPPLAAQPVDETTEIAIDSLRRDVDRLNDRIAEASNNDAELTQIAEQLTLIQDQLLTAGVELTPRLGAIRTRLAQLGPAPPAGDSVEPERLATERAVLTNERNLINMLIGTLEGQSVRARQLSDGIVERRRELFVEQISRRYDLTAAFGPQIASESAVVIGDLTRSLGSWAAFTWRTKQNAVIVAGILITILAVGWITFRRRMVQPWIARTEGEQPPTDLARVVNAFWFALLPNIVFWAFLVLSVAILDRLSILRPDIFVILRSLLLSIAVVVLVWRLSEAVLAPDRSNWRLIRVTNRAARQLKRFFVAIAAISMADIFLGQIASVTGGSLPLTVARTLTASVLIGALLLAIAFIRPFRDEPDQTRLPWPAWVKWPVFALGVTVIVSAGLGYIGFARFASEQIVITGAVLATLYLGYRAAQAITKDHTFAESRVGRLLAERSGLSEKTIDQIGLAGGLFLTLGIITVGLPVLALLWGVPWPEVRRFLVRAFTDIPIGSISISLTSILLGVVLFFVGYLVTQRFLSWLDGNVLERSGVETGARNSIRKGLGYLGIAIAALVAISAAGFNLSQIAIVAGALSVGIGFGLQNIVNNFVSGLILLAERPFKSGDIIEAGGHVGTVTNINVRATEIRLFDRKTLILPNSELINSAVQNWMHRNTLGRVTVQVGVSYDTDPERVYNILLEIAADHPLILGNPEPFVSFDDFGASSLDFVLYAFVADVGTGFGVRTDLRMAIYKRFKAEGIEIPFPQRDVNFRMKEPQSSVSPVPIEDVAPTHRDKHVHNIEDED